MRNYAERKCKGKSGWKSFRVEKVTITSKVEGRTARKYADQQGERRTESQEENKEAKKKDEKKDLPHFNNIIL